MEDTFTKDSSPRKVYLLKFEWTEPDGNKKTEIPAVEMSEATLAGFREDPAKMDAFFREVAHTTINDFSHRRSIRLLQLLEVEGSGVNRRFKPIHTFPVPTPPD